jgi:regulator of sigma E protease
LIGFAIDWSLILVIFEVGVALGMVIFVHELGHFVVAKLCGVKCEKFYLGFDIYGLKLLKFKRGETEYGIGILPLGGYVKMLGQEDNPAKLREEIERARQKPGAAAAAAGGTGGSPASAEGSAAGGTGSSSASVASCTGGQAARATAGANWNKARMIPQRSRSVRTFRRNRAGTRCSGAGRKALGRKSHWLPSGPMKCSTLCVEKASAMPVRRQKSSSPVQQPIATCWQ